MWYQVLQALSTPAIALLAVVIGVMQWRTAHQRAVLDLFQKRWDTYGELRRIISEAVQEGTAATPLALNFARTVDQAKFLFGPEVHSYLQTVYRQLVELNSHSHEYKQMIRT